MMTSALGLKVSCDRNQWLAGIGRGIAESLADGGAIVAVVDLVPTCTASAALNFLGRPWGSRAMSTDSEQVNSCLAKSSGGSDLYRFLVNNAGITR